MDRLDGRAAVALGAGDELMISVSRLDDDKSPATIQLDTLAPEPYELLARIPVSVEEEDGAVVASFAEANINASGETVAEALAMLREMIVAAFDLYRTEEQNLAAEPRRQLAVLRQYIRAR